MLQVIRARVPLIAFVEAHSGVSVDISVDNHSGTFKSIFTREITQFDARFVTLYRLVSQHLQQQQRQQQQQLCWCPCTDWCSQNQSAVAEQSPGSLALARQLFVCGMYRSRPVGKAPSILNVAGVIVSGSGAQEGCCVPAVSSLQVKYWAEMHGLNDPKCGTLNSWSITQMVGTHVFAYVIHREMPAPQ
jgi:hypothetical protein